MQFYNAQHWQYELLPVRIGRENKQIRSAIINCTNFIVALLGDLCNKGARRKNFLSVVSGAGLCSNNLRLLSSEITAPRTLMYGKHGITMLAR